MNSSVYNIIPKPVFAKEIKGAPIHIKSGAFIMYDAVFLEQAEYLSDLLFAQTDIRLQMKEAHNSTEEQATIKLLKDPTCRKLEMYRIKTEEGTIVLKSNDVSGIIYSIQSLLQIIPIKKVKSVAIHPFEIEDHPRFSYRGMHLDVSRHFYNIAYVKKYIDYLAYHKFNFFHWHLTDDQGWRIEIKAYPKLTTIGAWRKATLIGHFFDEPTNYYEKEYGGYYTQEEIKEVIQYAAIRGITIVPEIDIPGHSRAALAAYPELGTKPEITYEVATTWGMFNRQNNVLAPNPETFKFIEAVFAEVCELFPSPYIHIGGDECSKMWWKESVKAQAFMKEHQLKDEKELQTYFVNQTAKYVESKNKKVIAWHDVLEGDADASVIVMNWGTKEDAIGAVEKGYQLISTPGKPLYFDHYQKEDENEALAIHGYNSSKAVYNFEPVPEKVATSGKSAQVLGAQGNVWTEYMGTTSKVEYMIFPRMTALSEVLWSPKESRDFENFQDRLQLNAASRYRFWGANYGSLKSE